MLLECFRVFIFWESESDTRFEGDFLLDVHDNKPRDLVI
jgi:hypothetical protein